VWYFLREVPGVVTGLKVLAVTVAAPVELQFLDAMFYSVTGLTIAVGIVLPTTPKRTLTRICFQYFNLTNKYLLVSLCPLSYMQTYASVKV